MIAHHASCVTQKLYKKHVKENEIQARNYIQANVAVASIQIIETEGPFTRARVGCQPGAAHSLW